MVMLPRAVSRLKAVMSWGRRSFRSGAFFSRSAPPLISPEWSLASASVALSSVLSAAMATFGFVRRASSAQIPGRRRTLFILQPK
jgi:hypothetical protein